MSVRVLTGIHPLLRQTQLSRFITRENSHNNSVIKRDLTKNKFIFLTKAHRPGNLQLQGKFKEFVSYLIQEFLISR